MFNYLKKFNICFPSIKLSNKKLKLFLAANYNIFPLLWTLTFFIGVLESFTYPGFSFKHILLPFQPLLIISILSGVLARLTTSVKRKEKKQLVLNEALSVINRLMFLPLLLSYLIVTSLELQNYPNYVFSKIHLQPQLLFWPSLLSALLVLLDYRTPSKEKIIDKILMIGNKKYVTNSKNGSIKIREISKDVIARAIIISLVAWILANNLSGVSSWMLERTSFMVKYPLATYDEKMRYGWGDFYDYMLFIKRNSPENATIMYPPMINPWMDVGGGGLIRYFLYPREIIQNMTDENAEINPVADYAMLAWGFGICDDNSDKCHGWPRRKINSEWIIYKKKDSVDIEKILNNVIYDPIDEANRGAWGLIKIKKN